MASDRDARGNWDNKSIILELLKWLKHHSTFRCINYLIGCKNSEFFVTLSLRRERWFKLEEYDDKAVVVVVAVNGLLLL